LRPQLDDVFATGCRNICLALSQVEESPEEKPQAKAAAQFLLWALPRIEGHCKSGAPPKGKPVTGNSTIPPPDFRYWRIHPKVGLATYLICAKCKIR